ncbi:MAG: tetratricopeptide repeat protein [Bacillota bacterium]
MDNIIGLCDSIKNESPNLDPILDLDRAINEIAALIKCNELIAAEELLKDIFSKEELYSCGNLMNFKDRLFSFSEPIEEEFLIYKYKIDVELKRESRIRTELFLMYAYIMIEKKEYDEALRFIEKGISYNPVNTSLLFEKAEVYKIKGQWDIFKDITDQCYEYAYKCKQLARVYRNYGYMFAENGDFEGAACAYIVSLVYEDSDTARNELEYISTKISESIDADYYIDNAESIFEERSIRLGPNKDICELAYTYARNFEDLENHPAALYYYKRLYELTDNEEAKEKCEKIEKLVFNID